MKLSQKVQHHVFFPDAVYLKKIKVYLKVTIEQNKIYLYLWR